MLLITWKNTYNIMNIKYNVKIPCTNSITVFLFMYIQWSDHEDEDKLV